MDAKEAARWYLHTPVSFLGREDRNLDAKLRAEADAILTWAVDGWQRLQANERFSDTDSHQSACQRRMKEREKLKEGQNAFPELEPA